MLFIHTPVDNAIRRYREGDFSLSLTGKRLCLVTLSGQWVKALPPKL